ncbi:MAG: bifunctional (p)ppGpp synthetase/guanosine-3',5'-bis(diphosphate) 3'-pyrophosphohydrolase [Candidatus Kapabacteria bacterium]|nr:bifunctional (p)ppGpp synthetase/guanosine-3',5'-bis(diphosphate) 3'-pyrophosphohydrolase [Candidatus Kapabacteria bacterium]
MGRSASKSSRSRRSSAELPSHVFGSDVEQDLAFLLSEGRRNLARFNADLVERAFRFCVKAHEKDVRVSGEPYYTHPANVALIVMRELPLDDVSVVAALLHDVVEDTSFSLKDVRAQFGAEVADIVDGATKISDVFKSREITQAENYRKLLLSLVNDVRVILVKFADRLHNMRTIDSLSRERQERLARETMEIYAPFAHRFGLGNMKWELEDLSFKVLNPAAYEDIQQRLAKTRREQEEIIRRFAEPIEEKLRENGLTFEINGRPKHFYSIYRKMLAQGKSVEEMYDLLAIRIILDTEDNNECFLAYGIVSEIYRPIPERFKNFISVPKKNGYQSLHTSVISGDGKPLEIQIRTRAMHDFAERGVAAHFRYKADTGATASWVDASDLEEWATWVRDVFENAGDTAAEELLESFKLNLYQDEIYVFTPKGELRILPKGATPIDFAFDIHSQVGARCIGAKVNGKIVPLDHELITGDQVSILTSKNQTPHRDWERIAITHKAKTHIRRILNEERRARVIEGKELWDKRAKKLGLHLNEDDMERLSVQAKYGGRTDFYFALATGSITPEAAGELIRQLVQPAAAKTEPHQAINADQFRTAARDKQQGIHLKDPTASSSKIMFSYARCCNPVPGDAVVGIVTIGSGIKVHRSTCRNVADLHDKLQSRIVDLEWSAAEGGEFLAAVKITGEDRPGMLNDITSAVVAVQKTNIRGVTIDAYDAVFEGILTVYVADLEHLKRIFEKLHRIKGVKSVERFEE